MRTSQYSIGRETKNFICMAISTKKEKELMLICPAAQHEPSHCNVNTFQVAQGEVCIAHVQIATPHPIHGLFTQVNLCVLTYMERL